MSVTELHADSDTSKHDEFVKNHVFMQRKIYTFSPMQEGQQFVALISRTPMIFRGPTAIQANKAAKAFRREEVEREWARHKAGINRASAMREARKSK